MLASVLQESGYKVGLYTSPHLKDFRERIKINGNVIEKQDVVSFIHDNSEFLEAHKLSFFEMTVGLAFDCFAKHKVEVAIIEVGLGGRLDSTNIISPVVSVITNIGLDHTQFLGETLQEIAFEKGGIIKSNIPVIIGEYQKETFSVFEKIAKDNDAPLYLTQKNISNTYKTDLKGTYQLNNLKTAVETCAVLNEKGFNILNNHIETGLMNVVLNTGLLGRWQILQTKPKVICDTAHNKEGLSYVLKQLKNEKFEQLHIVIGVVDDKNLEQILPMFPINAIYYFCKPNIPRGLDVEKLKETSLKFDLEGETYNSVEKAYKAAMNVAQKEDLIYIGGSTFVVAEVV
jgi:dihydrofolate synthase/folylpolyglutamate synthase